MKKTTKLISFLIALLCNAAFFLLCGYGKINHPDTATYLDPLLGVGAVIVLALGNTGVVVQLYFRCKYRHLERRAFDYKFWRQCLVLILYYIGSLLYLSSMLYAYRVSYLSIFAIALSPLWLLGGSRTLWAMKDGEESYYLDEYGKWYVVHDVTENDNAVEIGCTALGDRKRIITIEKGKTRL